MMIEAPDKARFNAVWMALVGGFLFSFIWDLADGPDDIPPWYVGHEFVCD